MQHNIKNYFDILCEIRRYWCDIHVITKLDDGGYIFEYDNEYYMISDNGGETNVMLINKETVSIPHTSNRYEVTKLVLAYRISMHLLDKKIDYEIGPEQIQKIQLDN